MVLCDEIKKLKIKKKFKQKSAPQYPNTQAHQAN
jgi:hypothetical protein